MLKKICVISVVIGYLFVLGSVGAEELNHITAAQSNLQTIIGFAIMGGGIGLWRITA